MWSVACRLICVEEYARATLTEHVRAALDENTISKSAAARAAGISRPLLDSWLKR